jgi:hypothetical protein
MKRKIQLQPLQLSRETIRQLDSDKLAAINGGFTETITTIFTAGFKRRSAHFRSQPG